MLYRDVLRKKPPAIYYYNRLREQPIPNTENDVAENGNIDPNQAKEQFQVEPVAIVENHIEPDSRTDELQPIEQILISDANSIQNEENEIFVKNEIDPIPITEEIETELNRVLQAESDNDDTFENSGHESYISPNNDGNQSTNENAQSDDDEEHDNEVVWMHPEKAVPMPLKSCNEDALTKQENDPVSGKLPFSTRVSIFEIIQQNIFVQ